MVNKKCDGLSSYCGQYISWCGQGTFSCDLWNNEKGLCKLIGEKSLIPPTQQGHILNQMIGRNATQAREAEKIRNKA